MDISKSLPVVFVMNLMLMFVGCGGEQETPYKTWGMYKGDASSSSYSSLDQINKDNVNQLEVAWTYHTGDLEKDSRSSMQTNPIIVDGVLYGASPKLKVFAINAENGKERWIFDPFAGERARGSMRGVMYWEEGNDERILFSAGNWIYALDAREGTLLTEFGEDGRISLNKGLDRDPKSISVRASSPGIIYEDLLIHGSAVGESYDSAPGDIRAYDVRTGEIVWSFHTVPHPGEPGAESWEMSDEDLLRQGGVNNWTGMSLDRERGVVYIPLGSPVYDFYGGNRPGKNLYGNSLLALEAATGDYLWHYQTVHHDLWDYDLPAPPNLLTIQKDGKAIDAVAQVTKQGFVFVFERETGEPVFPIEEQPVPASRIASEQAWPTQPVPVKPAPFVRQGLTKEDLTNRTTVAHDSALATFLSYRSEGLYTPPDPQGSIQFPSTVGGANWGGAAHDPESGTLYINANEIPEILTVEQIEEEPVSQADESLVDRGAVFYQQNCAMCHGQNRQGQHPTYPALTNLQERRSKMETLSIIKQGGARMPGFPNLSEEEKEAIVAFLYDEENFSTAELHSEAETSSSEKKGTGRFINITSYRDFRDAAGYPAIKPPWGTLNAINLNTGEIKWKVPLGTFPELVEQGLTDTGRETWGGPMVTAGGLVFIAASGDRQFRAFDKETGDLVWQTELPAAGFATPATYMVNNRQYIVIAAGGGRGNPSTDTYVAFALPKINKKLNS